MQAKQYRHASTRDLVDIINQNYTTAWISPRNELEKHHSEI